MDDLPVGRRHWLQHARNARCRDFLGHLRGKRAKSGPSTLAVRASAAGNDLLLFAQDPDRARRGLSAVVAAVRAGRLSRAELVASVRRIAALRAAVR